MLNIAVCIKQVPAYSDGMMDPKTGLIQRAGLEAVMNVYDLPAIEAALVIKEKVGATVDVFTMGPPKAASVIREAYAMGADRGFLISDSCFSGADVLATSYTLMQGIKSVGSYDLIICGKQTTDGDTAQVSGALGKWFEIPHISWVVELVKADENSIIVNQAMEEEIITVKSNYPCLISVERSIFIPRIPSLKLRLGAKKKEVNVISIKDLEDKDTENYGLSGSATKVEKIFPAIKTKHQDIINKNSNEAAEYIFNIIRNNKNSG